MRYSERCDRLLADLAQLPSLAVAFSGGVDSSVLLHAAHAVLGPGAVGVIADSPSLPRRELAAARDLALSMGVELEVVETGELEEARYVANTGDRCFFCKRALFEAMRLVAGRRGLAALAFGEITDDALDVRPGARAAQEARVLAPLSRAGFSKADVRRYALEAGLPVAEKPASACLASRLPVGTRVSAERLARVERAEASLHDLGLRVVRVRDRGARAGVELGQEDMALASSLTVPMGQALSLAGFEGWDLAVYVPPGERHESR